MFYEDRPKITFKKTPSNVILEVLTYVILLTSFIYTIINYGNLPEQIPMHFNHSGKITRYGAKNSIWVLNIIGFAVAYGISYLNKFPHIFNYPVKITLENAHKYYREAIKMLQFVNIGIALLFAIISFEIIQVSLNETAYISKTSNYLLMSIIAILTFAPLIYVALTIKQKKD
ncbi:DUF1648 domain-containing protein [Bizionia sp. KMM 8389]